MEESKASLSFLERVTMIQAELKAPKGQYNSFGKYNYRSCEDILNAVKPLCAKYGIMLMLSDEPVMIGTRIYIKATARLCDVSGSGTGLCTTAFAREPDDKKGMDESQVTGTASSYARKYALNGLFLIDDTKDTDTDEYREQQNRQQGREKKQSAPTFTCSKCGKKISNVKKPDGTIVSAETVYQNCNGMCLSCYKQEQAHHD